MTANYETMLQMFKECNELYFNSSLPVPYLNTMNKLKTLARFEYNKNKNGEHPIKWQEIKISDCYEYTEEDFREMMVHEIIHYYIAWNGIKDNKEHGEEFMKIAKQINEKYNLNITQKKDASSFKRTEKAPQHKGFFEILFG
jgi:predicted SprT family Zn-dependent metalloprotease